MEIRNKKITPELARITAHICADGYVCIGNQKRCKSELIKHPRRNNIRKKYYIRYVNTEPKLVNQFIKDIMTYFNRNVVHLRRGEYELSGKAVYELITSLGAGKSREWFIADEILNSGDKVKSEWLKAFYDDEAYVCKTNKRIVLNIVNKNGLQQIKNLLTGFGIKSYLNGPYVYKKYHSYHLNIYRDQLRRYSELIGFNHPRKNFALGRLI